MPVSGRKRELMSANRDGRGVRSPRGTWQAVSTLAECLAAWLPCAILQYAERPITL